MCCTSSYNSAITFHGLRHTHASLLIDNGVSPKYVQKRLGHADVTTTLNLYVHTNNKTSQKVAEVFSNLLENE